MKENLLIVKTANQWLKDAQLISNQGIYTEERMANTFGKWKVSLNGDMVYDNGIYEIHSDQLKENNWINHLFGKNWINWNEFIPAYFQALRNIKQEELTMLIYYK